MFPLSRGDAMAWLMLTFSGAFLAFAALRGRPLPLLAAVLLHSGLAFVLIHRDLTLLWPALGIATVVGIARLLVMIRAAALGEAEASPGVTNNL